MNTSTWKWIWVIVFALLLSGVASGQQASAVQIDTVKVELTPYGFVPAQMTVAAGYFRLFVHNVSGPVPRNLALSQITNSVSTMLNQPVLNQTTPHWFQFLTLAAGTYRLTEANHPTWTCTITVK